MATRTSARSCRRLPRRATDENDRSASFSLTSACEVGENVVVMNDRSGAHGTLPLDMAPEGPRRRILEAALRLFATRGFHGSSVRDIVAVAEMQASAVYAHFASKEHVLAELARAGHEAHFHALQSALLDAGNDPVDQLRAFVGANVRHHVRHPFIARVVNAEMHALSDGLVAPALAIRKQTSALLAQIIERGIRSGAFALVAGDGAGKRHEHARDATMGAIGAMTLRLPYWFPIDGSHDVEALVHDQIELALRMVGARGRR